MSGQWSAPSSPTDALCACLPPYFPVLYGDACPRHPGCQLISRTRQQDRSLRPAPNAVAINLRRYAGKVSPSTAALPANEYAPRLLRCQGRPTTYCVAIDDVTPDVDV